jgi:dGTPase
MSIREQLEADERKVMSPFACLSERSSGRPRSEAPDSMRTCFQHDRDKVLHSKAFRRLAGKTQVFLAPEGDHYRTRITHTLEVAQIARTVCRAMRLNESLCEVIALGHDLGHTPFGHAGESVLARLMSDGFHHAKQSLRVVDVLEKDGRGLNLTNEVREGILKHSKGKGHVFSDNPNLTAMTLEGQIVRVADIVAYVNHDLDDAIRGGVLKEGDVPREIAKVLGDSHSERITRMVSDIIGASKLEEKRQIRMSETCLDALIALRDFLYARVYENHVILGEFEKAQRILGELWEYFMTHEEEFRARFWPKGISQEERLERAVADFISGMTDRYAMRTYEELYMPTPWTVY